MANQYGNLGLIYRRRGELDKAEEMHLKSLAIAEKLSLKEQMAANYSNLGAVYKEREDNKKAREYWEKALTLYKIIGMKPEVEKTQRLIEGIDE